jgi:hypothetical protein
LANAFCRVVGQVYCIMNPPGSVVIPEMVEWIVSFDSQG